MGYNLMIFVFCFVWFDSLRPSQQSFSFVRTGLPVLEHSGSVV